MFTKNVWKHLSAALVTVALCGNLFATTMNVRAPISAAAVGVGGVLDIDGNGNADALTDGLLVLRYMFGFRGTTLRSAVVGPGATRTDSTALEAYLAENLQSFNVDGDARTDALTDGLLVLRSLFGFAGSTLTAGAVSSGASRVLPSDIESYLQLIKNGPGNQPELQMCFERGERPKVPGEGSGTIGTQAAGLLRCKWDQSVLKVRFLDGDPIIQERVKQVAAQWSPWVNVSFQYGDFSDADIRISFREGGKSWSYLGPCWKSFGLGPNDPTMNFGWLSRNSTNEEVGRVVLHEFGHALGLIHEHQSPGANIPWDIPKLYEYYRYNFETFAEAKAFVDSNILQRENDPSINYTRYDPLSIMHYPVPEGVTIGTFSVGWNTELSALDKSFMKVWYATGIWTGWQAAENGYYSGDWDGPNGANLAVRRAQCVLKDLDYDGIHDRVQCYGNGNAEDQYLIGDWDGDGIDNLAVRRGNCVNMDFDFDEVTDKTQCFGNGNAESQYLVGDWDGDGKDNLAVRRNNCVNMDFNFDDTSDRTQCFGNSGESQYLIGDWDGDGKDNLGLRRDNCVLMDFNFDGGADRVHCFGNGNAESQYMVGDWNQDGRDDLAVRRGNCINMSFDLDGASDRTQCYGNGM